MTTKDEWVEAWHSGLRPREDAAFPKKCRSCGRIYETSDDFFTETVSVSEVESGLKHFIDDDSSVVVEVFRNCLCGSTLMDNFTSRRDTSDTGQSKRVKFDELLEYLIQTGLDADIAYIELVKVANGEESDVLSSIKPPE